MLTAGNVAPVQGNDVKNVIVVDQAGVADVEDSGP